MSNGSDNNRNAHCNFGMRRFLLTCTLISDCKESTLHCVAGLYKSGIYKSSVVSPTLWEKQHS